MGKATDLLLCLGFLVFMSGIIYGMAATHDYTPSAYFMVIGFTIAGVAIILNAVA
jgi:hypothetical protein